MIPVNLIHVQPLTEPALVAERVVRRPASAPVEEKTEAPSIVELPVQMQAVPSLEATRVEEPPIAEAGQPAVAPRPYHLQPRRSPVDEGAAAAAQAGAEIAAYKAILSSFRGRIVQEIRYPSSRAPAAGKAQWSWPSAWMPRGTWFSRSSA